MRKYVFVIVMCCLTILCSRADAAQAVPLTIIDGRSGNNNGRAPELRAGTLYTRINAGAQSGRSEVMWGDENTQRLFFLEGDTVIVDFDVVPGVCGPGGALPLDRTTWHVVYQLHGALKDNSWSSGPPVTLVWERGLWFLRGGYTVKQADGSSISLASQAPATPNAPCGVSQHWRFDQKIGGPGVGVVNAWLDGRKVVDNWMPRAGTMYANSGQYSHSALQIKNGIYAGGYTSWDRTMEHRNIVITRMRSGQQKTWQTQSTAGVAPTTTLMKQPPRSAQGTIPGSTTSSTTSTMLGDPASPVTTQLESATIDTVASPEPKRAQRDTSAKPRLSGIGFLLILVPLSAIGFLFYRSRGSHRIKRWWRRRT